MSNFFNFLKSFWRKPKVIIITGEGRKSAFEAVSRVLKQHFKIGQELLIFESGLKNLQELQKIETLIKKSESPIIITTHTSEIPADTISFGGDPDKLLEVSELVKVLTLSGYLILNSDDEAVRDLEKKCPARFLTFGFSERADFIASDIKINPVRELEDVSHLEKPDFSNGVKGGINFKINYKGNTVPVWLENKGGKEQIYSALATVAIGTILGLNLVEISQAFKRA